MSAIDVNVVVTAVIRGPSVGVSSGAPYVQPMALEGVGWALGGLERIREDLPTLLQSERGARTATLLSKMRRAFSPPRLTRTPLSVAEVWQTLASACFDAALQKRGVEIALGTAANIKLWPVKNAPQ